MWVEIFKLPLEYWTPKGISYIAKCLGRPLYVDRVMEEGSRINLTRACIEIGLNDLFPKSMELLLHNGEKVNLRVEYGWKPLKCVLYNKLGHEKDVCVLNRRDREK